jgi:uncharacterized protein YjiK
MHLEYSVGIDHSHLDQSSIVTEINVTQNESIDNSSVHYTIHQNDSLPIEQNSTTIQFKANETSLVQTLNSTEIVEITDEG